jgi:hypothetical protein
METGKLEIPKDNSISKIVEGSDSQSFLNNLIDINFYIENKNYIYILLVIIALAIIGFYLHKKYFKLDPPNNKKQKKENEKEKEKEKNSENDDDEDDKKILNPMEKYYIVDKKGNPILINPFLNDLLTNNIVSGKDFEELLKSNKELRVELEKIKNDNSKKQKEKEKEKEKERPKLSHPNENTNQNIPDNILMTDVEDENLATQDLTDGEIAELKKQLQILQRNQNYKVMAQNDEDDD